MFTTTFRKIALTFVAFAVLGMGVGVGAYGKLSKKPVNMTAYSDRGLRMWTTASTLDCTSTSSNASFSAQAAAGGDYIVYPLSLAVTTETAGSIILGATVSVGTNSPNYNNIFSGIPVPTTAGQVRLPYADVTGIKIPANTPIVAKVTSAVTGVGATCTARVHLLAFTEDYYQYL